MSRWTPPLWDVGFPFRVASTLLLAFAIYGVVEQLEHPTARPPAHLPPTQARSAWKGPLPLKVAQLTQTLEKLKFPRKLPAPLEEDRGADNLRWIHRSYDITLPRTNPPEALDSVFEPLREAFPESVVQGRDIVDGREYLIGIDGLRTHTVAFHWLQHPPRIAIVIDDLGDDILLARKLLEIEVPLTLAVAPLRPFSRLIAERAALGNREILLRMPERPSPQRARPPGPEPLPSPAGTSEEDPFERFLAEMPQARGILPSAIRPTSKNRFDPTEWIQTARRMRLFFVAPEPEFCSQSRILLVPCLSPTATLSTTASDDENRKRFSHLLEVARTEGTALAVAPPDTAILSLLEAELPLLKEQGFELAPASKLLEN